MTTSTPGQRLAMAIKESKRSKRQIAIAIGVKPQSITNAVRRGKVSARLAQAVAAETGHRWEWILMGEGAPHPPGSKPTVRAISQTVRQIPVISLSHAATWPRRVREGNFMGDVSVDSELAEQLGPTAFCMVIDDDAMRDNSPESVSRGDRVLIDPAVLPRPGDLVVATATGLPNAVFRKYRERGMDANGGLIIELVPLNPDYAPTVSTASTVNIVGVMVEHRRTRRREI